MNANTTLEALEAEIAHLKSLLAVSSHSPSSISSATATATPTAPLPPPPPPPPPPPTPRSLPSHALLLLSDSALPLGSFAFSSGLESYLAHNGRSQPFASFLSLSLLSLASTSLPYLLAAHREPHLLRSLDSTLDACILCPVARRASVAQGRALLTVWERAFCAGVQVPSVRSAGEDGRRGETVTTSAAAEALAGFGAGLKIQRGGMRADRETEMGNGRGTEAPSGHFAPLWAIVTRAMGVAEREGAYVFLLNHAKAVVSAGVRASVMGPYQAQGVLASAWLRKEIERVMDANWDVTVEDAGQTVPAMDLWVGRHEMLYSRIFNS